MKIEDMSLEELLRNHRHGVFPWDTEILSLFAALTAENAELKRQVEGLKYTIRLSYGWLRDYSNDSDNATHAKRILQNEIFGWLSGDTTKEVKP